VDIDDWGKTLPLTKHCQDVTSVTITRLCCRGQSTPDLLRANRDAVPWNARLCRTRKPVAGIWPRPLLLTAGILKGPALLLPMPLLRQSVEKRRLRITRTANGLWIRHHTSRSPEIWSVYRQIVEEGKKVEPQPAKPRINPCSGDEGGQKLSPAFQMRARGFYVT